MTFWRSHYRRTSVTKSFQIRIANSRVLDEEKKKILPSTELVSESAVRVKGLRESRNISSTGSEVRLGNFVLCI